MGIQTDDRWTRGRISSCVEAVQELLRAERDRDHLRLGLAAQELQVAARALVRASRGRGVFGDR